MLIHIPTGLFQFEEDLETLENNLFYYLDIILQTDWALICC